MTIQNSVVSKHGILIDYEFCTNCHTCEIACQKEHGLEVGRWGIKVLEYGPVELEGNKWEWTYLPLPTGLCDLCADRTSKGRLPTCVHHCQSGIMYYGTLEELTERLVEKPNQVMYSK